MHRSQFLWQATAAAAPCFVPLLKSPNHHHREETKERSQAPGLKSSQTALTIIHKNNSRILRKRPASSEKQLGGTWKNKAQDRSCRANPQDHNQKAIQKYDIEHLCMIQVLTHGSVHRAFQRSRLIIKYRVGHFR